MDFEELSIELEKPSSFRDNFLTIFKRAWKSQKELNIIVSLNENLSDFAQKTLKFLMVHHQLSGLFSSNHEYDEYLESIYFSKNATINIPDMRKRTNFFLK